jgi:hypothetical protein
MVDTFMTADNTTMTHAQMLLKRYKITAPQIALAARCSQKTVLNSLNIERFSNISAPYLAVIRAKSIMLLQAMGWRGNPDKVWAEYDATLSKEQEAA